ncbi:MAG: helix-turn-helix domain-containing protein [Candidatus Aenigmarchaeota archaeon]|nr:helix-turn-helix domain-containing protein [Candidatus Aenigmarchaeota archaeon]
MKIKNKILHILKKNSQGLSISEIAKKSNVHRHTASRYILELKAKEVINIRKVGPTKLCFYNEKNIKGFSSIIPLLLIASFIFISLLYFHPIQSFDKTNPSANIINTQSYPTQYGNWTINFATNGTSDLIIAPSDGTSWKDIEPIEVLCGNVPVQFQKKSDYIFVPKYSCSEDSTLINKVLTSGVHNLKFNFGSSSSYAHNLAGQTICEVPFSNIVYEFNDSSGQDILTIDSSGNLYIKASSVNPSAASIPSSTNGFGISVSGTNEFMFNRTHAYLKGTINDGSVPSAGANDVLIRNASDGTNLTLFQGTGNLYTLGAAVYQGGQAGCSDEIACGDGSYSDWNGTRDWLCNITSFGCDFYNFNPDKDCTTLCKGAQPGTGCSSGSCTWGTDCNLECQGTSGDANCKRYNSCSGGSCAGTTNCPANYHCSSGSGCVNSPSIQCNTTDFCSDSTTRCTGKTCDGSGNCNVADDCAACPTSCVSGNNCKDYTGNCANGVCTISNCAVGKYCTGGSCTSGACNSDAHCADDLAGDNRWCTGNSCNGNGGCTTDYGCTCNVDHCGAICDINHPCGGDDCCDPRGCFCYDPGGAACPAII